MKPILLKQVTSSRWEVYVSMDAARRMALRKSAPLFRKFPDVDMLVVVKGSEGTRIVQASGTIPSRFSRSEADGLAHQIGYYGLDIGSFVSTYTDVVRIAKRDALAKRDARRTRRYRQVRDRLRSRG